MTIDRLIESVMGGKNFLANLALIDISTWQTSQEVYRAWQNGVPVQGVNTANMGIYQLVNGEPVFDLLGREGNPFVDKRFREEVYHGIQGILADKAFFFPSEAMKEHILAAINAGRSARVCYSGLRIQTKDCGSDYRFVEVDGENTREEKKLFVAVYGTKNPGNGKRIYLLREDVVMSQLKGKEEDDVIARACYFNDSPYFLADVRYINDYFSIVRGVRRGNIAEGDAKKIEDFISVQLPCSTYAAMKAGQPFTFEGKKYQRND